MSVYFPCHHCNLYFKREYKFCFSFVCSDFYAHCFLALCGKDPMVPEAQRSYPSSLLVLRSSHCVLDRLSLLNFAELTKAWRFLHNPLPVFYSPFLLFPFSVLPTYVSVYVKYTFLIYVPVHVDVCLFLK